MLVQTILQTKGDAGVFTVPPATSIAEAAAELSARKIGTVVVSDDGAAALGILSERDIVREIGKRGAACLSEKVAGLMTRKLVTCAAGDTADSVLQRMTEGRFRHMPVLDGTRMIGLISLGDVVKARLQEVAMEKDALQDMIMGY
ncbi:MAG: CBS domain-containing protein [Pseudomonadota bacterium]